MGIGLFIQERYLIYINQISPTAAGSFAAIMAMASRIYKDIDPSFAANALTSAEKAWQWGVIRLANPMYQALAVNLL